MPKLRLDEDDRLELIERASAKEASSMVEARTEAMMDWKIFMMI